MIGGRGILAVLAVCALAALAPATASARTAYFTFTGEGEGAAAPIDLGSGALGSAIAVGTEGAPFDVAITPDGSTAYVAGFEELVRIDVATNTAGTPIPMPGLEPAAVAISPDGQRAYTANSDGTVSVLDLATGTQLGAPIVTGGSNAGGIAVTPDGTRAYVTATSANAVTVIDLANATAIGSIGVGEQPQGIAVTPDGSAVYVANRISESVSRIDTATNAVTATIPTGPAEQIAISPDGGHAYAIGITPSLSPISALTPIDLATATAGTTVLMDGYANDVAILPDGSRAYITNQDDQQAKQQLLPFDLSTDALGSGLPTYEHPFALAIVPNQPPHAAISGPASALPGTELSFDGSGSTDSDGSVARYDWDFGDGTSAANAGAVVGHAYANPGTYQVTLTTTDNEGCSTAFVFTGQTAYCNGSSVARATHEVTVAAKCKRVVGKATSFTPKIRPGHVVPGVRVRLAVGSPARLKVKAKLLWTHKGNKHRTQLRKLSVNVNRWRRVRFPIPSRLRKHHNLLPLGRRVRVRLTIRAVPRGNSGCAAATTHKTLRVRVVKVFPHAVQHKRPR